MAAAAANQQPWSIRLLLLAASDLARALQAAFGKCNTAFYPWMLGKCDLACGRCSCPPPPAPAPPACSCTDIAPDGAYTCAEQVSLRCCGKS